MWYVGNRKRKPHVGLGIDLEHNVSETIDDRIVRSIFRVATMVVRMQIDRKTLLLQLLLLLLLLMLLLLLIL